jgi:hypothetical protein
MEFQAEDPYSNKEFYVKWRHWSHIHCSWDTRETLLQLAGYKRVKNYIKRMEDLDRRRRVLSREEIELIDVERQMEYEMALQHQVVRNYLYPCTSALAAYLSGLCHLLTKRALVRSYGLQLLGVSGPRLPALCCAWTCDHLLMGKGQCATFPGLQ